MTEEIPDEAVYQITAEELDSIFHQIFINAESNAVPTHYADGYISGKEDGVRQMHREIVETADIVIE